jgi:HD-GYP domain-containing protein (c-di-GMP phosphodiesterase class II)
MVLDLSQVDSLGGGSARLLNEFAQRRAKRGEITVFFVTSPTVRGFLRSSPSDAPEIFTTMSEAIEGAKRLSVEQEAREQESNSNEFSWENRESLVTLGDLFGEPQLSPPLLSEAVLGDGGSMDGNPVAPSDSGSDEGTDAPIRLHSKQMESSASEASREDSSRMQQQVVRVLRDRNLASRAWVFQLHEDDCFYLITRNGTDFDRSFTRQGALAARIRQRRAAVLLYDLCGEPLEESEEELLAELNCEVVAPVPEHDPLLLVFLSKEQPGDEYSMEELEEVQGALASVRVSGRATLHAPVADPVEPVVFEDPADLFAPDEENADDVEPVDLGPGHAVSVQENAVPTPSHLVPTSPNVQTDRERQLRRHLTQMRDILHLSQDFDASFGTARILEVLVLSTVSVARANTVLYFAHRNGEYRLTHHRGLGPDSLRELRLREDSTVIQAVLRSERGVQIDASSAVHEDEKIWARQHGLQVAVPFRFKDAPIGVLLLGNANGVCEPDLQMLSYLTNQAALAYDRAQLWETLQDRTLGVVRGLVSLIESRSGYDCGSTEQVVRYTQALARETQYPSSLMRDLVYGAVLRDVGMLRVSETLLRSPQDLSADQWESIRRHPIEGANIMRQMCFSETAVDVVLHHHEAYNGEGYPMGLRGRAIPLGARIVAVAESYVKMTMDRPYRKALGRAEALESMAENWGLRYDPLIVDALVRVVNFELSVGLKGTPDITRDLFGV